MAKKIPKSLHARLARVKLFLCDVDGVLTDGSIFIGGEREFKRFNIRDGLGLVLARRAGLKVGWVSARARMVSPSFGWRGAIKVRISGNCFFNA